MQSGTKWWLHPQPEKPDVYGAFRIRFDLDREQEVEIRDLGASWYVLELDGRFLTEGPARFEAHHPQYGNRRRRLAAGHHLLTAQVHYDGVPTRMLDDFQPFLACRVLDETGQDIPLEWRCEQLHGYRSQVRRMSAQFGWIEWCETARNPRGWRDPDFDDSQWARPFPVQRAIGPAGPLTIGEVRHFHHPLEPVAQGPLAHRFGYALEDIPTSFFLRDRDCEKRPATGLWHRYDLGRVRLFRPRFVIEAPADAVVEMAYAEELHDGKVAPYINLSITPSCNLDHYAARGGRQCFQPLTPRGGRFIELHVIAPPDQVRILEESAVERCYFDAPQGDFRCGDALLDRIWQVGVETFRGCSEDALTDNPTRERGQWTGDVVTVGLDICSVAYGDLRLLRRGLWQSACCAREDGLIPGLCPGNMAFMSTYAAQWIPACLHYHHLSGERELLEQLLPAARRNLGYFERHLGEYGLIDIQDWTFIDWGHVRNEGPSNMALNLHYRNALLAMREWYELLDRSDEARELDFSLERITAAIHLWLEQCLMAEGWDWQQIGYHAATLALHQNFFEDRRRDECIAFLKKHILRCFPMDREAPRLGNPDQENSRLITPYFMHYALPPLIEAGEMDFVLDVYRRAWGWALEDGRSTWVEVFDDRWSHCHQWAGCPTWQLSRYALGLHPRQDRGPGAFDFRLEPGSLERAEGRLPLPGRPDLEPVRVQWQRRDGALHYRIDTTTPLRLRHFPAAPPGEELEILDSWQGELGI